MKIYKTAKVISTQDCVQYLIGKYPNTNAKDWKRLRKFKDDGVIARDFQCVNAQLINFGKDVIVRLYEVNGQITEDKPVSAITVNNKKEKRTKYLWAYKDILDNGDYEYEMSVYDGYLYVGFNDDSGRDDLDNDIEQLLIDNPCLENEMECVYGVKKGTKNTLLDYVRNDPQFSALARYDAELQKELEEQMFN